TARAGTFRSGRSSSRRTSSRGSSGSRPTPRRRASGPDSFGGVTPAPLVAGEPPALERDHALAHLVDHLAIVGDHENRRAGAIEAVQKLHDPHARGGVQ